MSRWLLVTMLLIPWMPLWAQVPSGLQEITRTAQSLARLAENCDVQLERLGAPGIKHATCQTFMRAYLRDVDAITAEEQSVTKMIQAIESDPTAPRHIESRLLAQEFLHATDQILQVVQRLRWVHHIKMR